MTVQRHIHLGYAVGTGEPVEIPLAHTFVTGQTQRSGKTTTLRAIVARSGCRSLAFVTKRGESFDGRRVRPYLPREGSGPIPWRLVETIVAAALGQRSMGRERFGILNACKGATSLAAVRDRAASLLLKAKGSTAEMYELLCAYLDLILPDMAELDAAETLDLRPGLNVMDLAGVGPQLQALVIRAALERVNQHERGVLTVFPEAWEFAPRDRSAPAKDEAIAMARKGAVLGNFLLCDSQDIAGVDTVVRQAATVWLLGVQKEANELKRSLAVVKASGVAVPRPDEVATLAVGQFFACWDRHAIKTYVQPDGMEDRMTRAIARGTAGVDQFRPQAAEVVQADRHPRVSEPKRVDQKRPRVAPMVQPQLQEEEDEVASKEFQELSGKFDQLIAAMGQPGRPAAAAVPPEASPQAPTFKTPEEETLYQRFKGRLLAEFPGLPGGVLHVTPPEKLRKDFQRQEADRLVAIAQQLRPLTRRVLKLVETTADYVSQKSVAERLGRATGGNSMIDLGKAVKELAAAGFVEVKERQGVRKSLREKVAADLAFYNPADGEVEAVYQAILYEVATAQEGK